MNSTFAPPQLLTADMVPQRKKLWPKVVIGVVAGVTVFGVIGAVTDHNSANDKARAEWDKASLSDQTMLCSYWRNDPLTVVMSVSGSKAEQQAMLQLLSEKC
jgi:hypothetical protein